MKFLINVEPDNLDRVTEALRGTGLNFQPDQALIDIDDYYDHGGLHLNPVHHGHEITEMIQGANRFLAENGVAPRLPNPENLTVPELADLLEILNCNFLWRSTEEVERAWWDGPHKHENWQRVTANYPRMFSLEPAAG